MTKHRMINTSEYLAWRNMKGRCYNPNDIMFPRYGGRGITVCDRWRDDFLAFYADMGSKPSPEYTLERRDNNQGYYPGNCRWATETEQARNRSTNFLVVYRGREMTVYELVEITGSLISPMTVWERIRVFGYSVEDAIGLPLQAETYPKYEHGGKSMILKDWARELGLNYNSLYMRISRGMSFQEAISKPFRRSPKGSKGTSED